MTKISFILCTYNSPDLVKRCIDSVLRQDFLGEKEIIIIDGGSDNDTLEIIERYKEKFKFIRSFHNEKQLPEGHGRGKWLGWKKCTGEFVMIIDQDNELQGKDCIRKLLEPFWKEEIFGCLCLTRLKKDDSATNRYIALMGTDPFFAYKSIDGLKSIKRIGEDRGDYLLVNLDKENPLITGGNCFVYRKKCLDDAGGYVQDTENIVRLVDAGYNKLAVSKNAATHHLAVKGFLDFVKKKKKWAKAYQKNCKGGFSYLPKTKKARKDFLINLFSVFAVAPATFLALKQFIKTKEKAWLLHPILAFITGFIYFCYAFPKLLLKPN